jgi:hypothetical protein
VASLSVVVVWEFIRLNFWQDIVKMGGA